MQVLTSLFEAPVDTLTSPQVTDAPRRRDGQGVEQMQAQQRELLGLQIADVFFSESLFDGLPNVVFFVKDIRGRYVVVNQTLAQRCGLRSKYDLIGRTPLDLFGKVLASSYVEQDRLVLATGEAICDQLELHMYPNHDPGWCLTHKKPLFDQHHRVVGLAGISRDLGMPDSKDPAYTHIAAAANFVRENYERQVSLGELAWIAGMSEARVERYFKKIFYLSPRQMLIKVRLEAATRLLAEQGSITDVAMACGYNDHSAFTRQFKATVGTTPTEYRALLQSRRALSKLVTSTTHRLK